MSLKPRTTTPAERMESRACGRSVAALDADHRRVMRSCVLPAGHSGVCRYA